MASHAVVELLAVAPADGPRRRVRARLACGCVVDRDVPADRVLDVDAGRIVVGKIPCPEAHPVQRPDPR